MCNGIFGINKEWSVESLKYLVWQATKDGIKYSAILRSSFVANYAIPLIAFQHGRFANWLHFRNFFAMRIHELKKNVRQ